MKSIPLTRARHATNFATAMEAKDMPVERLLSRSGLPVDLVENVDDNSVISALNMLGFAENAALDTGIEDLGFWAGTCPIEKYGNFGIRVTSKPSLYEAIQTYCAEVKGECSEADYYLLQDQAMAWFCHGPILMAPSIQLQHELYALMIMVQVIQLALGADWQPKTIRLQTNNVSGLSNNDFLLSANIEFGAPITAICVPLISLAKPVSHSRQGNSRKGNICLPEHTANLSIDPMVALQQLITGIIQQSKPLRIELAAEAIGTSKRTLQRYLQSKGTNYSNLVDQARYKIALPLLKDRSISITEISYEIGYSHLAHFSRSFKRTTGMSPRAYRIALSEETTCDTENVGVAC